MSTRDIPEGKLRQVARYLDKFPPLDEGQEEEDVEEYWVLLLNALRRLPNPLGSRFSYTRSQLVKFGEATENDGSPSVDVLRDLQKKDLPFNEFVRCLEKIGCQHAFNVFQATTSPEITRQPQAQVLRTGDELQLKCEAYCKPGPPEYFWFRFRDEDTQWEPLINSNTNKLVISDVNTGHSGLYTCRVTNPHIEDQAKSVVFSSHVQVTVEGKDIQQNTPIRQEVGHDQSHPPAFPPVITTQPSSITVEYGQQAVLRCQASGEHLIYDWYKNGVIHKDSAPSGELVIHNAKQEDNGNYYCDVINRQGGNVHSKHVTITVVPVIVIDRQPPSKWRGEYGEEVRLECSAHSPKGKLLVYQWVKDKRDIRGATDKTLKKKFETRSHYYRLSCRVSLADDSSVSVVSRPTQVTVDHMRITKQPKGIQGYIGEPVELVCEATIIAPHDKTTKIDYLWLKSDRLGGKKEPLSGMRFRQEGGRLIFNSLEVAHNGFYICQPCLDTFLTSDEVQVTVAMPGDTQVRIGREPVSWVVSVGGEFRMACRAEASSQVSLQYQWHFNHIPIPGATSSVFEKKDIKESDYGVYLCSVHTEGRSSKLYSDGAYVARPHFQTEATRSPGNSVEQWEAEKMLWTIDEKRYARDKVALLIGNQRYDKLETLKETEGEITKLAKKLEEAKFKVFSFVNLTLKEMTTIFTWFCGLLSAGVYGLFYYSGHGFNCNHVVYLMPVDSLEGSVNVQACLASDFITYKMQKTQCRAIVMLDCCQVFNDSGAVSGISTPQGSLNMSNIVEIHSCPEGQKAYEHSSFNTYVIESLDKKLTLGDFLHQMPEGMRGNYHGTRPFQRGSFMDPQIAFHDDIMRDDLKKDEELEKIWDQWELAHRMPPRTKLELQNLYELLSIELGFKTHFTNVLSVFVYVRPKTADVTLTVKINEKSLADQCVAGELLSPDPNSSEHLQTYEVRVMNIQRLKKKSLTLHLCLSACLGQQERLEEVVYELPNVPLFAILQPETS